MVLLGVPEHAIPVHAFSVIPGRRSLAGSMIGSIKETQEHHLELRNLLLSSQQLLSPLELATVGQ
jgi:D-arabinose 1-dehydrogenase-like Zn-dependent alcohol dehydrogenase